MTNTQLNRMVALVLTAFKGYANVNECAEIMKIIVTDKPLKQHKNECHARMSSIDSDYYKKIGKSKYVIC